MIAVDSSVVVSWLTSEKHPEVAKLNALAASGEGVLPAVAITELLSDPNSTRALEPILAQFPPLDITDGYWERAGLLRAKVRKTGRKAALGDALIAQACIDANVPLLTRDTDFAAFVQVGGLTLA